MRSLYGWAIKNIEPIWNFNNNVEFSATIFRDQVLAIIAGGEENVKRVRVTVEVVE